MEIFQKKTKWCIRMIKKLTKNDIVLEEKTFLLKRDPQT